MYGVEMTNEAQNVDCPPFDTFRRRSNMLIQAAEIVSTEAIGIMASILITGCRGGHRA